jgi:hypothetical protein
VFAAGSEREGARCRGRARGVRAVGARRGRGGYGGRACGRESETVGWVRSDLFFGTRQSREKRQQVGLSVAPSERRPGQLKARAQVPRARGEEALAVCLSGDLLSGAACIPLASVCPAKPCLLCCDCEIPVRRLSCHLALLPRAARCSCSPFAAAAVPLVLTDDSLSSCPTPSALARELRARVPSGRPVDSPASPNLCQPASWPNPSEWSWDVAHALPSLRPPARLRSFATGRVTLAPLPWRPRPPDSRKCPGDHHMSPCPLTKLPASWRTIDQERRETPAKAQRCHVAALARFVRCGKMVG